MDEAHEIISIEESPPGLQTTSEPHAAHEGIEPRTEEDLADAEKDEGEVEPKKLKLASQPSQADMCNICFDSLGEQGTHRVSSLKYAHKQLLHDIHAL